MSAPAATDYAVVVPAVGRDSLHRLLRSLSGQDGPGPSELDLVLGASAGHPAHERPPAVRR